MGFCEVTEENSFYFYLKDQYQRYTWDPQEVADVAGYHLSAARLLIKFAELHPTKHTSDYHEIQVVGEFEDGLDTRTVALLGGGRPSCRHLGLFFSNPPVSVYLATGDASCRLHALEIIETIRRYE